MNETVQKALEKMQKAEAAATDTKKSLEAAQTDLAAKPQDKNLVKKVTGLQTSLSAKTTAVGEARAAYDEAVKKAELEAVELADPEVQGDSGSTAGGRSTTEKNGGEKIVSVRIKHKSSGQFYYRCGLRVKKDFETYAVPVESIKRLKADLYIVFEDGR